MSDQHGWPPPGDPFGVSRQPGQQGPVGPPATPTDATQGYPNFVPPSAWPNDNRIDPLSTGPGLGSTPPPKKSNQVLLFAVIIGGLFAVGMLGGIAVLFLGRSGDDAGNGDETAITAATDTTSGTPVGDETPDDRIGTTVAGIGLRAGDCINYDDTGGNISEFDIVTCDEPHLAQISAEAEHPDAGQDYPGVDVLSRWAEERCTNFTSNFVGSDIAQTSLIDIHLVPDFKDWNTDGLYRIQCLVISNDGSDLTTSVEGAAADFPRGSTVAITRLVAGECFTSPTLQPEQLGSIDVVEVVDCSLPHDGVFFGGGVLAGPLGDPYPGDDAVATEAVAICDRAFRLVWDADPNEFFYNYWSPRSSEWALDDRTVDCGFLDNDGLQAGFDPSTYRALHQLEVGTCFMHAPGIDGSTQTANTFTGEVPCSDPHDGQFFGKGELAEGSYPGEDAADTQILDLCAEEFESFVGISTDASADPVFSYWVPSEEQWNAQDRRWVCAFLWEEPSTLDRQGTNS